MSELTNKNIFSGENVVKNTLWSISERVLAQAVSFIISVILARLLMPNDYGVVALIQVFIGILSIIIDKGLAQALNQKKHPDKIDYYSVITFGFVLSLFFYALLCGFAPYIANYFGKYNKELLCSLIRIMGIALPISAINVVEKSYISKHMMFKKFFWATFVGTIISGIIGVTLAYKGFGAYALVAQHLINLGIDSIILAIVIKKPVYAMVDFGRLKSLLSFGWKVVVSSCLNTLVESVRSSTIAKEYTAEDLGYYNKGESLPKIVIANIDISVANVLFPTLSNSQDDLEHLKLIVRKFVRLCTFIIFPILMGLFAISDSLVPLLFGSQWIPAVPYLKIFCVIYLFYPLQDAALLSIRAIKKSGVALIVDIIGKSIILALLFGLLKFGPLYMTIGYLAATVCTVIINAFAMQKYIGYKAYELLVDILKNSLLTGIMFASVNFLKYLPLPSVAVMVMQIALGILVYFVISKLFRSKELDYILGFIKRTFSKLNTKEGVSGFNSVSIARPIIMAIAIVWIVLFHSGIPAPTNSFARFFYYIFINFGGGLGVAIFMILSGFGLMYSNQKRCVYTNVKNWWAFMAKRLIKILIPYTIVFVSYYLIMSFSNGTVGDFFAKYSIYEFFNSGFREFWYVHAILVLYLIFPLIALCFDKLKTHWAFIILLVITAGLDVGLSFISPLYGHIEIFLTRIPCFIVGCLLGKLALQDKRIKLIPAIVIIILFIASIVLLFAGVHYSFGSHIMRYVFSLVAILLVIVLSMAIAHAKVKFRVLKYLGSITLELYLTHILMFCILKAYTVWNIYLILFITIVSSISLSILLNFLQKKLLKKKSG